MKYDSITEFLEKLEEHTESCLRRGVGPALYENFLTEVLQVGSETSSWLFILYSYRWWLTRDQSVSVGWHLKELRMEMVRKFVPTSVLYEVARKDEFWTV